MSRSLAAACFGLALCSSSAWALSCASPTLQYVLAPTADSPDTLEGDVELRYDGTDILLDAKGQVKRFLPVEAS